MSDLLPAGEIQRMTGYKRPGDQLRELHRLGFWRARLAKVTNEVILERPHYDAVKSGRAFVSVAVVDVSAIRPAKRVHRQPMRWDVRTALYRHFDKAGVLLYVGIAVDPDKRAGEHRREQEWAKRSVRVTLEWFDTRREAMAAESAVIRAERPKFNTLHQQKVSC